MLSRELETARQAARAAGAAAMEWYGRVEWDRAEGFSPVTAADRAANTVIIEALRSAFPDDAILSEESKDSAARLSADRVWIVDPLDGTKEFIAQNGEFAVMIGLAERGAAVLGVVYAPATDTMYSAARGAGAWMKQGSGEPVRLTCPEGDPSALRMVGSRSHADELTERIREGLGCTDVQPSGSVGIKCALIATGQRDLYVHPVPYLKEWDTCAPEVVLREAGGDVTDCAGDPLTYNKPVTAQLRGIMACGPGLREPVLRVVSPLCAETLIST
ncbi:MAG TPA: 3'(2'),5'-bisphosphate nucleotidase CysQ [Longimicrobiales bacterium]|nr:3'(2'),5'-bisphosphate nucleotidase CysQ [Longimicrobiales bacterium]